jgi:hypothetical protein
MLRRPLRPHELFAWLGLLLGLAYVFLTPPFTVADEPAHFYRAYQLSTGHVTPEASERGYGWRIPESVLFVVDGVLNISPRLPGKLELSHLRLCLGMPLKPRERRFIPFSNMVIFPPTSYAPQTLGILIARALGGSAVILLYAGRLLSLLTYLWLITWAIRASPIGAWIFCLIGLSPMSLSLAGSVSADATTIALAFALSALTLRQVMDPAWPLTRRRLLVLGVLGLLLALAKIVYFPLVFLVFLIPAEKFGSRRRALLVCTALAAVAVAGNLLWNARVGGYYQPMFPGVDFKAQVQYLKSHPLAFAATMARTYFRVYPRAFLAQVYGKLGWLSVSMPRFMTALYYLLLLGAALSETRSIGRLGRWRRWGLALASGAVIALIGAALYISCTPVASPLIQGIQGRYFIPILPLPFLAICARRPGPERRSLAAFGALLEPTWPALVSLFAVLSAAIALWRLCGLYYGF